MGVMSEANGKLKELLEHSARMFHNSFFIESRRYF